MAMASARFGLLALFLAFAGPAVAGDGVAALVASRIADYDRLVIDWRQAVDYRVTRVDGRLEVSFATAAALDTGRIDARTISGLQAVDVTANRLVLVPAPGVRVRHYRTGRRFVLDLLAPADVRDVRVARIAGHGS